jgi:hypothetical protein
VPLLRVLAAAVVRGLVVVVLYAGVLLALHRTDGEDALGVGLLYFLLVALLALTWAAVDAARQDVARTIVVWVLAGAFVGLGIPLTAAVLEPDSSLSLAEEVRDGFVFLVLLVAVPALVGAAVGAVVRRSRSAPARG